MAKCNQLTPVVFKGLNTAHSVMYQTAHYAVDDNVMVGSGNCYACVILSPALFVLFPVRIQGIGFDPVSFLLIGKCSISCAMLMSRKFRD